jgi:multicomponent Na+:H+ antiporter subunit A
MLLTLSVFLPLLAAPVLWQLLRNGRDRAAPCAALLPLGLFAAFASMLPAVQDGIALEAVWHWIPSLGIAFALRADGLSLLFALLITGIGTFIFLYASRYLAGHPDLPRFFARLTLFMAAMLGAVLADDLITLLVFWEMTSLASFLLIGFEPEKPESRRSAQQGLLLTVGGGLALLAGAVLLGSAAGTMRISEIVALAPELAAHPGAPWVIVLVAAGAFAKSAQVPLHAWLANAMVAPTPVSAFLHSATMVKLGVYLLARLNPVYSEHALWVGLLLTAGLATMLTGAVLALRQTDLKRVLAYSTIVSLGTLVMLLALPHPLAATAMVTFLIVHALYKACLFMVAGIVDHEAGTRDTTLLGGLRRSMPLTASIAILAGLSMAGLPPFVGFVAKELVYEANLSAIASWWPLGIAILSNAVMVAVAGVVTVKVFLGQERPTPQAPHDPPTAMWLGPALLALGGLALGLAPSLAGDLVNAAATAVSGQPVDNSLSLWHGLTPMLALSLVTMALGLLVYHQWDRLHAWFSQREAIARLGPDASYDRLLTGLQRLARWQTTGIQSGSLRLYTGITLAVVGVSLGFALLWYDALAWPALDGAWTLHALLPLLLVLSAAAVLRAPGFMSGIVAAGIAGFGLALVFLFHGAPDLAFTQFSVEAVAIVVLLSIVGRMPFGEEDRRTTAQRRFDALIAGGFGAIATALLLAVLATPFDARLSDFFRAASVPEAHGRNLVNVIIVDFRALDTLGEITVLALAALAAAAVLAGAQRARRNNATTDEDTP